MPGGGGGATAHPEATRIKAGVEHLCGGAPQELCGGDDPMVVVKRVDGTVLDTVRQT